MLRVNPVRLTPEASRAPAPAVPMAESSHTFRFTTLKLILIGVIVAILLFH